MSAPTSAASPSKSAARPGAPAGRGRRNALAVLLAIVVVFLAGQLVPVHRINPPATVTLAWESPQTEHLARVACMDCHSNETRWPWYSRVAPASWLVYYDVETARSLFDISESPPGTARPAAETQHPTDLAYRFGKLMQYLPLGTRVPPQPVASGRVLAVMLQSVVLSSFMPPARYLLLHPDARLTATERRQLVLGLQAALGLPQTP